MTLMVVGSNREEVEKGVKAKWVESSAFAGDGTRYWVRVPLSDYPDREAALEAAHSRAVYLASRG